jgi:hypothetical protein
MELDLDNFFTTWTPKLKELTEAAIARQAEQAANKAPAVVVGNKPPQ